MSMPSLEPEETSPAQCELLSPAPIPSALSTLELESDTERAVQPSETSRITLEPAGDGWALIALIPYDGDEPPASVSEELAQAVWCAVSAIWHPSLLARAAGLPRIESVDSPSPPGPREIRVIASGAGDQASFRLQYAGRGRAEPSSSIRAPIAPT